MAEKIEIEDLREAGEDGGDLMGYFARGHHDTHEFAEAANRYSRALTFDDRRHVYPDKVRLVWYRTVQMEGETKGTMQFIPSKPGPGAWAATVATPLVDFADKQYRARKREHDRGYEAGMQDAMTWVLSQLMWGLGPRDKDRNDMLNKLSDDLRKAYRDGKDAIPRRDAA